MTQQVKMFKHLLTSGLDTKCRKVSKRLKINSHRGGVGTSKKKEDRDNNVTRSWKSSITNSAKILNKKRTGGRLLLAYRFVKAKYFHWLVGLKIGLPWFEVCIWETRRKQAMWYSLLRRLGVERMYLKHPVLYPTYWVHGVGFRCWEHRLSYLSLYP